MKLAEALIVRANLQKQGASLKERLKASAKVQSGEEPPENMQELLREFEGVAKEMLYYLKAINKTNSQTEFEPGKTLTDALAERDVLTLRHNALSGLVEAATIRQDRYSRSEVVYKSTIDVPQIRKQIDSLARDFRELDTKIQQLNWQTELID